MLCGASLVQLYILKYCEWVIPDKLSLTVIYWNCLPYVQTFVVGCMEFDWVWVVDWVGLWVQSFYFAMGWVGLGQSFGGMGWRNWTHGQLWRHTRSWTPVRCSKFIGQRVQRPAQVDWLLSFTFFRRFSQAWNCSQEKTVIMWFTLHSFITPWNYSVVSCNALNFFMSDSANLLLEFINVEFLCSTVPISRFLAVIILSYKTTGLRVRCCVRRRRQLVIVARLSSFGSVWRHSSSLRCTVRCAIYC